MPPFLEKPLPPATEPMVHDEKEALSLELPPTTAALETSKLSIRQRAHWETTKRLLAQSVNEELAIATIEKSTSHSLVLRAPHGTEALAEYDNTWIQCGISTEAYLELDGTKCIGFVRAEDLRTPVLVGSTTTSEVSKELDPIVLCRIICGWHHKLGDGGERFTKEIQSSTDNQLKWLEIAATQPRLHLGSPMADWEQSVVTGHPAHPLHKTCLPRAPLEPITPEDIPGLLSPEITFISVPRSELRVTGPFEQLLEPLLQSLKIPQEPNQDDRIIVPCFTRQLPGIVSIFPQTRRIQSIPDACRAQISMRSVSFKPEIFSHHLKLSLLVQITGGLRIVSDSGAVLGPVLSKILPNLLPPDVWFFEEPASITGIQSEVLEAGLISCIIRKLPEQTKSSKEILIPGAGLYQKPFNEDQSYMETLFGLDTLQKKQDWFRKYAALLFSAVMPPLVRYGIGFESHLQNILVRVNGETNEITGFAIRDLEGTRIHYPTFLSSGYTLDGFPKGFKQVTDNLQIPWGHVHHSIIQDNVGPVLHVLGLESNGGWSIVREELERVLSGDSNGRALYQFFTKETMPIPRWIDSVDSEAAVLITFPHGFVIIV
ncbi:IucC family-domain-containing protein [Penicillium angulare]|uniref:IucC family-domain-containing protein n=1 Tax=Penicillium angulare TaxID=116970 RepID=A0A9W9K8K6_9EURO|nr:IucC family-domain-containing protein [Penicillium angulare]